MTPDALLSWAVRRLPAQRRPWGRAMQAELASLEHGRWRFALSCARGVLGRPETIFGLVRRVRPVRAAGAVVLVTEALVFLNWLRLGGAATAPIVVWTVMLTIYAVALRHAPARGAAIGAAAAAAWLAATVVDPAVPTSNGPALLVIALAVICARGRIAGLCAGATAALLIAVSIDGPLRVFSPWVANSAPPVYPPEAVERLVDSIGIWMVGCLLAVALSLAVRASSHVNVTSPR
jgi:hypothetical protein